MKRLSFVILAMFAVPVFICSCKKNSLQFDNVIITQTDNGKTVSVNKGETFGVTVNNPGDGGFNFDTPQYDTTILRLSNHTHTPPPRTALIGNFGTDTFEFMPLKQGTTTLNILASRRTTDTISIYKGTIKVQ